MAATEMYLVQWSKLGRLMPRGVVTVCCSEEPSRSGQLNRINLAFQILGHATYGVRNCRQKLKRRGSAGKEHGCYFQVPFVFAFAYLARLHV